MSPATRTGAALLAAAAVLATAPAAPAADARTASSDGGLAFVETPRIAKVACVRRCAADRRLQGGSTVRISGRSLATVTTAVFLGSASPADDLRARVVALGERRLRTRVPRAAVSGPIALLTSSEVASVPSAPVDILPPLPPEALASLDHVFPIRGKHRFGGAGARFGSGRSGHSHEGQDVFAACGTPLVAARGGTVQVRGRHRAAGHYLVIDADGSDLDYAYMHLEQRSPFRAGDRVVTGQRIGSVGDSGNARGCHLHFELWTGPGWYEGGRPVDPLRALRAWRG